jgi:hypothetical protein
MQSIVIKPNGGIDKPWDLVIRTHDMGGTGYHTLARLTDAEATAVVNETVTWLYGEPDWEKHHKAIDAARLKREIAAKQEELAKLEGKAPAHG